MSVRLSFETVTGVRYQLQESSNLVDWETVGEAYRGNGDAHFFDASYLGETKYFRVGASLGDVFKSEITGIEYPINVHLPDSYNGNTNDYPIIYATDGQWVDGSFSAAVRDKKKELILVTIAQGPEGRRAVDFRLPGATNYFEFFKTELLPAIESVYRVDEDERTICGLSYGGLFTGLLIFMDDVEKPVFKNYLSFDGSFWYKTYELNRLGNARLEASKKLDVTLYLTSAVVAPNNHRWVEYFENRLDSWNFEGLNVIRRTFQEDHNHVSLPSFKQALDELF